MAFLSGVLGAVKNENEVTTYDNDKSRDINTVINKLEEKIGTGRAGLVESVRAVKRWLEGYERKVTPLTDSLTSRLGTLKTDISTRQKDRIHDSKKLTEQLVDWKDSLSSLLKEVELIENDHVKVLDNALKCKVESEMKPIKSGIRMLKVSAENEKLAERVSKVEETLQVQFTKIFRSILALRNEKQKNFDRIREAITMTTHVVEDALGYPSGTTRLAISRLFDAIRIKVEEVYKKLYTKNTELYRLVEQAEAAFAVLKEKVGEPGGNNTEPNNKSVYYNWGELKSKIPDRVNNEILDSHSKTKGLMGIQEGIESYTKGFSNASFETKLKEWLTAIIQEDKLVGGLLDEYVSYNKREVASNDKIGKLQDMVGGSDETLRSVIISAIVGELKRCTNFEKAGQEVASAITNVEAQAPGKIEQYINAVKKGLTTFLGALEETLKIKQGRIDEIEQAIKEVTNRILKAIERQLSIDADELAKESYSSDELQYTVRYAVHQVLATVKQKVTHLEWLTGNMKHHAKLGNVDTAIHNISELLNQINGSSQEPGDLITRALGVVKQKILDLHKYLVDQNDEKSILKKVAAIYAELQNLDKIKKEDFQIGFIEKEKENASANMETLRDHLQRSINYIRAVVEDSDRTLNTAIDAMRMTLSDAHKNVESSIRSLFAESHRADLSALRSLVDQQLQAVQDIIAKDRVTGVKGMLKTLSGVPINHKGNLKDEEKLLTQVTNAAEKYSVHNKANFDKLVQLVRSYYRSYLIYVHDDVVRLSASHPPSSTDYPSQLKSIFDKLVELLNHLEKPKLYAYDHTFVDLRNDLNDLLTALHPSSFAGSPSPLLAPLKSGLSKFAEQLGHAYVSRYSGQKYTALTSEIHNPEYSNTEKPDPSIPKTITNLTPEGRNCAKVCLTIVEMVFHDLSQLRQGCVNGGNSRNKKTCLNELDERQNKITSVLGKWLQYRGYRVSDDDRTQNGELKRDMRGEQIHNILVKRQQQDKNFVFASDNPKLDKGELRQLVDHLDRYWKVCHLYIPDKPKTPSNINQMLNWYAGLRWSPQLIPLFRCCKELFETPKDAKEKEDKTKYRLEAYPSVITYPGMAKLLQDVSLYSQDVLIAIQGHGHAGGRYAVDFRTNIDNFDYPSNAAACFDMLVDISYRVYDQLYFLLCQCQRTSDTNSWRECWYGRNVGGSSWQCNTLQCANQACPRIADQNANQNANQIARQTCDQHPSCGLKSPLQSFLEDGLPGFLPHEFKKPGCKLECTVSNHRGILCKTPMGFTDIRTAASHTQKGHRIMSSLDGFCGNENSPLKKFCASLQCLLQRTPQTLGDMFAFYYNFTNRWNVVGNEHREAAFNTAVSNANFGVNYEDLKVYYLFSFSHSEAWNGHSAGSLGSLVCLSKGSVVCGPYLRPINKSIYTMFSSEHADKYLSWIVYLTSTFYDLLKKLYEECDSKCGSKGSNCHAKACVKGCRTTSTTYQPPRYHDPKCKSIVQCNFTLPTMAKYGFVLGDPDKLNENGLSHTKRTCRDFCNVFKEAFEKDSHLVQLFKAIDDFLFAIRTPFFWATVALWSLSLFYLICVMVGRLDVLHIRSHLRSPSSHKITAQSLLAAAQVGRLAKISYLQP